MPLTILCSTKGKDILAYHGHQYMMKRINLNGAKTWRCKHLNKYRCNATMVTSGEDIVKEPGDHNHAGDQLKVEKDIVISNIRAASLTGETTRSIIGAAVAVCTDNVLARLPKKSTVERKIQRTRKNLGEVNYINPENRNFEIPEEYNDIIMYDTGVDDPLRIIVLGNIEIIDRLRVENLWFGDGTFDVVPSIYYQLYTVHCKIGNNYPPCIYFLLPNKTQQTYVRMVEIIHNLIPQANPQELLLDFEVAAHNGFRHVFPDAPVSGCFFHLSQSVQRKVSDLGLKLRYENDIDFSMLVKSLSSLAFIPIDDVGDVFNQLADAFPGDEDEHADQIVQFLIYFETTYIRNRGRLGQVRPARFQPELWNHMHQALDCLPKTTNCVEGFHNALRSMFLCKHPTIWVLLNGIRRDIGIVRYTLQQSFVQNNVIQRSKYKEIERRLEAVVRGYEDEEDVLRYLRSIAHIQNGN